MGDELKIILAIAGPLIGAILTTFKDEIINFFSTRKYKALKGNWDCTWTEVASGVAPRVINDIVEIKRINGRIVSGTGTTQGIGSWHFKGEISDNTTITLTYKFDKSKIVDNSGSIILKLGSNPTKTLEGVWSQYKHPDLKGGTTEWTKI